MHSVMARPVLPFIILLHSEAIFLLHFSSKIIKLTCSCLLWRTLHAFDLGVNITVIGRLFTIGNGSCLTSIPPRAGSVALHGASVSWIVTSTHSSFCSRFALKKLWCSQQKLK